MADMVLEDRRTGQPGNTAAARGNFARAMEALSASWHRSAEASAREDKDGIARPLAGLLRDAGYRVWYDEFSLTVGDSLRSSIDKGLAESDFGVVILSQKIFEKPWPQQELNGLASKETHGNKVILPVWHQIGIDDIRKFSPILADRIGVPSDQGVRHVAAQLVRAMKIVPPRTALHAVVSATSTS